MTQRRYEALGFATFVLQVLAWVSLILGLLSALGIVLAGAFNLLDLPLPGQPAASPTASLLVGVIAGAAALLVTAIQFVGFLAASQIIHLFIDVEQNTRATADAVRQLLALQFVSPAEPLLMPDTAAPVEAALVADERAGDLEPLPPSPPAEPTITVAAAPQPLP